MDLGSYLVGTMLVGEFAIEHMDHLIASHVAEGWPRGFSGSPN